MLKLYCVSQMNLRKYGSFQAALPDIVGTNQQKITHMFKRFLESLLKEEAKPTRQEVERREFVRQARNQFIQLKEKGISIPLFTL